MNYRHYIKYTFTLFLLGFLSVAFADVGGFPETQDGDPRHVRSKSSPSWLEAIGKIVTTNGAALAEACSVSLIADSPEKDGVIIVGAGHCVDHWASGNGGFAVGKHSITWTSSGGVAVKRTVAQIIEAEMVPGDYFIAKLDASIPRTSIKPLLNAPYDYFDMLDEEIFGVEAGGPFDPYATMAGFSADTGLGQKGEVLTYHERCRLNGGERGLKQGYCYSYSGASGGPVVVTAALDDMSDEEWQTGTQNYFVGSIVGARSSDNSKTMFTEATHYATTLDSILATH